MAKTTFHGGMKRSLRAKSRFQRLMKCGGCVSGKTPVYITCVMRAGDW